LATILANTEMVPDKPFELDLCGDCEECVKSCPLGALAPYKVDDRKCLVGVHPVDKESFELNEEWRKYEPSYEKLSPDVYRMPKGMPLRKRTALAHPRCLV